jgi:hypothetical protein
VKSVCSVEASSEASCRPLPAAQCPPPVECPTPTGLATSRLVGKGGVKEFVIQYMSISHRFCECTKIFVH